MPTARRVSWSGHGIDAFSAGVQTFRAFHCLVAISGNLDREGGNRRVKRPAGFTNYIEVLHKPEFRLPLEVEKQTIGADRFPLWAGPEGWQTSCHNPSVIEAVLSGKPYPVRAMYVSGVNIVITYPRHAKDPGGAQVPGFFRGGHPHDEPHRGICGHRAAQDNRVGGRGGLAGGFRAVPEPDPAGGGAPGGGPRRLPHRPRSGAAHRNPWRRWSAAVHSLGDQARVQQSSCWATAASPWSRCGRRGTRTSRLPTAISRRPGSRPRPARWSFIPSGSRSSGSTRCRITRRLGRSGRRRRCVTPTR